MKMVEQNPINFTEMVARQGHSGAHPRETAESKHELKIDKSHILSQALSVRGSVAIAIQRLQQQAAGHPEAKGISERMSQFAAVESDIDRVISALESGGLNTLSALSGMEAAISSTLSYEEDSSSNSADNKADDAGAERARLAVAASQQLNEKIAADPLMLQLAEQGSDIRNISLSHAALTAHAITSANDAKADVDDTVKLAAMIYSGASKDDVQRVLNAKEEEMYSAMRASDAYLGISNEIVAKNAHERREFIELYGDKVSSAMLQGGEATRLSLLDAAEASIDLHAGHLKADSIRHFDEALYHLSGSVDERRMNALTADADGWDRTRHNAHHELKDALQEMHGAAGNENGLPPKDGAEAYLQNILSNNGISDVLDRNIAAGQSHAKGLAGYRMQLNEAVDVAYAKNLDTREALGAIFSGRDHSKIKSVAESLGMDQSELAKRAAVFQEASDVPFESSATLNAKIDAVNTALHAGHGAARGQASLI